MEREALVRELHKPVRKNFKRRKVVQKGINDTWQIDLVEMIPYSHENKGFKYIMTIIDIFSKFAYAIPIKNKSSSSIVEAMKSIFKQAGENIPKNIQTDEGKEFKNVEFKNLMKKYQINHYNTFSKLKASIVERLNRTLKSKMWPRFNLQGNYKWLAILKEVVDKYNKTKHSTIKMKPIDVTSKNESFLLNSVYNRIKQFQFGKFKKGDYVRISKEKGFFYKGYLPNWSTEIFKIIKVNMTNPVTYTLQDLNKNTIDGKFYEAELQKTKYVNTYLVEKVLKRKGEKVLVKWLGFDNSSNSWINKKDLL